MCLSIQKWVFLIFTSLGCLIFTVQKEVCAKFDTRRLFIYVHLSAEGGEFLCAHPKSEFKACAYQHDFVRSRKCAISKLNIYFSFDIVVALFQYAPSVCLWLITSVFLKLLLCVSMTCRICLVKLVNVYPTALCLTYLYIWTYLSSKWCRLARVLLNYSTLSSLGQRYYPL